MIVSRDWYCGNNYGQGQYVVMPWQYTSGATYNTLQSITVTTTDTTAPPTRDPEPPTNVAWLRRRVNEICGEAFKDIAA